MPFKGGVLVAAPVAMLLPIATNGSGRVSLSWSFWPSGIPHGSTLYFQCAIQDAAAYGVSLSNAILGTTP